MSKTAHIVAIKTATIGVPGFGITDRQDVIDMIFDRGQVWIGPRPILELDPAFVQPIPYLVIRKGDDVLAYTRGAGGGDARLHEKVSIGFGGHVDLADAVTDAAGIIDLRKTMENACVRELEEELGISLAGMMPEQRASLCNWTHVIHSVASPVDSVHIGLVNTIDIETLPAFALTAVEEVIENARWANPDALFTDSVAGYVNLESWSSLVLSLPFQASA